MNWKVLAVGVALTAPLIGVLAVGFKYDPKRIESPLVGRPAPEFSLAPLDGGAPVTLTSLRGKPAVINFWATWCVACEDEHPILLEAARQLGDRVQFVSIVYQDEPAKIRAWLAAHGGIGFPTLIDTGLATAVAYGVYGVPETYVIDAEGTITYKFVGAVSPPVLVEQLRPLLAAR